MTTHTPVLGTGQAVRTYGVARALAAHGRLTLLYARFGADEPDAAFARSRRASSSRCRPRAALRRALAYARRAWTAVPDGFARGISPRSGRRGGAARADAGRGRVVADGPIAAAALGSLARRRPVIYNAHNLESGFRHERDRGPRGAGAAGRCGRFERLLLERAAESWMVSEADHGARRPADAVLRPTSRLRYVPNVGRRPRATGPVPHAGAPATEAASGRCSSRASPTEPNRDALAFLLDEVFPRVWARLPAARLAARRRRPAPGSRRDDPRIEAAGFVETCATSMRAPPAPSCRCCRAAARR